MEKVLNFLDISSMCVVCFYTLKVIYFKHSLFITHKKVKYDNMYLDFKK